MARADRGVPIRSAEELVMARQAAQLAAEVLAMIEPHVVPGVTTDALDRLCHDHIVNVQGARPANVGYLGYPKTVLTSVNHVVCHGIPSPQQTLKKGDIVNVDVAVEKDGWYGDTSRMFCVGTPSTLAQRLVHTTYEALCAGIREVKPGATLGDVGHAIAAVAHREKFSGPRTATNRGCVPGSSMSLRWSSACGDSPRCATAGFRRTPRGRSRPWRWPTFTLPEGACRDRCARKGPKGAQRLPKQALWGKAQYLCGPFGIQMAVQWS